MSKLSGSNKSSGQTTVSGPLAAPKPQRNTLDLFSKVAQHIKSTPSPPFRQSSPHLSNAAVNALLSNTTDRSSSEVVGGAGSEKANGDVPITQLAEHNAAPFLGDQLSVHEGLHRHFTTFEPGKLTVDGLGILRMSRAQSLEGLASSTSDLPVMIKMPKSRAFSELGDAFEAIPANSWLMPYIVACCPPLLLQQLVHLPRLIDVQPSSSAPHSSRADTSHGSNGVSQLHFHNARHLFDSANNAAGNRPNMSDFGRSVSHNTNINSNTSFYQHKSYSSRPPFADTLGNGSGNKTPVTPVFGAIADTALPTATGKAPNNSLPFRFPSSWRALGVLLVSQDPSWRPWETKMVFLLDNFLLEATSNGSKLIGFAPLAGAKIKKCPFTDPHGRTRGTGNASRNNQRDGGSVGRSFNLRQEDLSYGLVITCFTKSDRSAAQSQFWITCTELQDLDILENALVRASRLRVEDVFDLPNVDQETSVLGRGRFNEVRLGRRKRFRIVDRKVLQKMMSPAQSATLRSSASLSHNQEPMTANIADLPNSDSNGSLFHLNLMSEDDHDSAAVGVATGVQADQRHRRDSRSSPVGMEVEDDDTHPSSRDQRHHPPLSAAQSQPQPQQLRPNTSSSHLTRDSIASSVVDSDAFPDENMVFGDLDSDGSSSHRGHQSGEDLNALGGDQTQTSPSLPITQQWTPPRRPRIPSNSSGAHVSEPNRERGISSVADDEEELHLPFEERFDSRPCALKLVSKEIFWERVEAGKERGDALIREVLAQLLLESHSLLGFKQQLNKQTPLHMPFVRIYSVFETQTGFALELELMESMDLFDTLAQCGVMSEEQVRHIIAQVVDAVSFCHRLGIAHRDIKLSNITFPKPPESPKHRSSNRHDDEEEEAPRPSATVSSSSHHLTTTETTPRVSGSLSPSPAVVPQADAHHDEGDEEDDDTLGRRGSDSSEPVQEDIDAQQHEGVGKDGVQRIVKLADFGMAGFLGSDKKLRGRCGTPGYVAPEILSAGVNEAYGINVDMFSVGVVAYTLLCGYEPFYGQDNADLLRANRCVEYEFHSPEWDEISPQAKDWIKRALEAGADTRLTPEEGKRHAWLADLFPPQISPRIPQQPPLPPQHLQQQYHDPYQFATANHMAAIAAGIPSSLPFLAASSASMSQNAGPFAATSMLSAALQQSQQPQTIPNTVPIAPPPSVFHPPLLHLHYDPNPSTSSPITKTRKSDESSSSNRRRSKSIGSGIVGRPYKDDIDQPAHCVMS